MKKTKTKSKAVSEKGEYHVDISVNGVVLEGSGNSFTEALTQIINSPDFPYGAKTKVVMNYTKGSAKGHRAIQTILGRRLLNIISLKPTALEVFAQKLENNIV